MVGATVRDRHPTQRLEVLGDRPFADLASMGRHETVNVAPSLEHPHDRGAEAERDVEVHMSDDITHPPTGRQRGVSQSLGSSCSTVVSSDARSASSFALSLSAT